MHIQWYPGHMHKASKQIKETLPKVDLIIEILDARLPHSSENPMINALRGTKPCIKIFSKCDLADPQRTLIWQDYFEQKHGVKTLAISTQQPEKIRQIPNLCRKMLPGIDGSVKSINTMIMGIPNVGKSTLINILAGRTIANTGNEPAITKTQQLINLKNGIVLFDTPGVLWPNIENQNAGYRLAATGAIKDTALDYEDVAFYIANFLLQHYPDNLKNRFEFTQLPTSELGLLETIGKNRGCLRAGGQVELSRVSKILIAEFRAGTLGGITLETPELIEKELAEVVIQRQQKAERKEKRKQKWKKSR